MNIQLLAREITEDPLGVGYDNMPDSEVARVLNEPSRPGKTIVPATEVRRYILLNGLWPRIQAVAASNPNPQWQGTAITILQTIAPNSFDEIRMDQPAVAAAVQQMLSTMVSAGAITQKNVDDMVALGDATISRAAELGLGTVHHLDVGTARQFQGAP